MFLFCTTGPPSAPVGPIQALSVTRDSVTLQWKRPKSDGGSPLTGYIVEKREGSRQSYVHVTRLSSDVNIVNIPGLMEGHDYYFRVIAENRYGRSSPLESDMTITPKKIYGKSTLIILIHIISRIKCPWLLRIQS